MKTCSKCHQAKDEKEFYKNKSTHDGLYACCKNCHKEAVTKWIAKNPARHNFYCSKTPSKLKKK